MSRLPKDISSVQSTYRQIFKATSIFGGVQIVNIVVTIVRGKILSVILGPAGMGINGLLLSTINMLKNATSLGIPESAVRNIAAANSEGNKERVERVLAIFSKWIVLTLAASVLLLVLFSRVLSNLVFGDHSYTYSFMALSISLLLGTVTGATYTVLRGLQKTTYLAIANIAGSILGLATGLPLIYFYRTDGIVPSIIMSSFVAFLISFYFRRKVKVSRIPLGWRESLSEGLEMARLGISLSTTMLLTAVANFALPAFITANGSIHDAGLYNSAVSLTTGYVGLVFTAMITDYFPRLSGTIHDQERWKLLVNQQAELVVLILTPILVILIVTAPFIIRLLLTAEFMEIALYLPSAALGIFLQGVVWSMAAVIVAKGDYRTKLYTEIISQLMFIGVSLLGYILAGLSGLGVAFLMSKIFDLVMISVIAKRQYEFLFSRSFFLLALSMLCCCLLSAASAVFLEGSFIYIAGSCLVILTFAMSYYELNKRIDFRSIVKRFII